jgi:hypothetical protein
MARTALGIEGRHPRTILAELLPAQKSRRCWFPVVDTWVQHHLRIPRKIDPAGGIG